MDNRFDSIDIKLEKLDQRMDRVDVHLERYNTLLDVHIKRSEMLEEAFKPVQSHVIAVQAFFKWLGAAVGLTISAASLWFSLKA